MHDGEYDTVTLKQQTGGDVINAFGAGHQLTARSSTPPAPHSTTAPISDDASSAAIGLLLVIASSAAYSSMSLLVSLATQLGVPSMLSATFRFAAQTALSIAWIAYAHRRNLCSAETWLGKQTNRHLLVQRGIVGAVAMCGLFYMVSTAPLADATCIAFLNVPVTAAVAAVVLGERYTYADGLAATASAVGVVLVVQPSILFGSSESSAAVSLFSLTSGLIYAVFSALVVVTVRAIGPGESAVVLVLYFGVTGCIVAPLLLITLQVPTLGPPESLAKVMGLEAGICILGFVGQVILNRGMQLAPAGPAAAMRYCDIIFALVFQVGVQGVPVSGLKLFGALLTMSGVGAVVWKSWEARIGKGTAFPSAVAISPASSEQPSDATPGDSETSHVCSASSLPLQAGIERSTVTQTWGPGEASAFSRSEVTVAMRSAPAAATPHPTTGAAGESAAAMPAMLRSVRGFIESLSSST